MSVDAKCNNVWQTQGLLCGQTLDVGQCTHSTRGNNGGGGGGGAEWEIRKQGRGSTRVGEPGPGGAGESCLAGAWVAAWLVLPADAYNAFNG